MLALIFIVKRVIGCTLFNHRMSAWQRCITRTVASLVCFAVVLSVELLHEQATYRRSFLVFPFQAIEGLSCVLTAVSSSIGLDAAFS